MGTYTASVKPLWEIIDQIADALIALPEWEEGDATWDTSDKTLQNARRVIRHVADGEYISLIMENGTQQNASHPFWRGLVIIFSSGWDAVGHKPDGTKYYTFAGFEGKYTITVADLATLDVDYRLFTWASGFALVGVPLPVTADDQQSSFIAVVERNADKLYADGFTNFYVFVDGNYFSDAYNTGATYNKLFDVNYKWWKYSRPFAFQSQTGFESPYDAILSKGDDKVYLTKPVLHNDEDHLSPIYQAEMFMMVDEKLGLVNDDEIALAGTKKYQIAIKQSPDSKIYLSYAMMKAE